MPGFLLATLLAAPGLQDPQAPADTLPRTRLDTIQVTVARRVEHLIRLPMAAGVVTAAEIRGAQPTLGLDESVTLLPGVYVANRWNFSLDQRMSIRGFGSRANFGVRGVKMLLDGVPQTLPDGQSQLTNVEFATLERIEVLRGAASALYGNASGGAILLQSERPGPGRGEFRLRGELGSFGSAKWVATAGGRQGDLAAHVVVSRFTTDGVRQQSAADLRQVSAALFWTVSGNTEVVLRGAAGNTPRAENPGALTAAELAANRDSAAAGNILRGADKRVTQQQASVRVTHGFADGGRAAATVFGLLRDLENPLATPPPGPPSPTAGTYNTIDRAVAGARVEGARPMGGGVVLAAGFDAQRMRDERENRRSVQGAPTDSILADQREVITELGPFVQAHWSRGRLTADAGARHDRVAFEVTDRWLGDGADNSGRRTMSAWSGNFGVSLELAPAVTAYGLVSTAFETPTSTELVNQADATVGFNEALDPQRARSLEAGVRAHGAGVVVTLSAFTIRVRDAIIQVREQSGRAFFANAGRTRNRGLEAGLSVAPAPWLDVRAAYTLADYRFTDYRVPAGQTVDTLDGNRLAGVPKHFLRAGLTARPARGAVVTLDQVLASSLFADDRNRIEVDGWGAGVTNLRASWTARPGGTRVTPFLALQNLFDRRYVGSVTINGAAGRVFEPAPRRNVWVGLEIERR
jgi:iron complex outermembrane receptor protein